jgi:inorganic pyrophosphatase
MANKRDSVYKGEVVSSDGVKKTIVFQGITIHLDRPKGLIMTGKDAKGNDWVRQYKYDYGFIPNTLAEDGAPLDAMVIMDEPTFAGCLITARPIGILDMVDCGAHDGKLLCVPAADPRQRTIRSIRQIAPNQLEEVAEFFRTYKNLEGRVVEINGWLDADAVPALLERCIGAASRHKN